MTMGFLIEFRNTLNFKPFREKKNKLKYACPWSCFCGPADQGIVLLKPGALMRCYSYVCPDLGSASTESINGVAWYFNETVKNLDGSWCVHFESQRALTNAYPGSKWDNMAGFLIDRRRREHFTGQDAHFISAYYLTLTKKLPGEMYSKLNNLFYKKEAGAGQGFYNMAVIKKSIQDFMDQTEAAVSRLAGRIYITPLNDNETASYLHTSTSTLFHPIDAMKRPCFIDSYITDVDLDISSTMKLGDFYIPIICIRDFPLETWPAMLQILNSSEVEYRWSVRWISRSKEESARDIDRYQRRFYGGRKTWSVAVAETVGNFESGRENPAAVAFQHDTEKAIVELSTDQCSFGYFSANMMVWDASYHTALDKARYVAALINSAGFTAKIETNNAFNAFLSMQPGNFYSNVIRPVLSSGNLSHIIPLSSVWSGIGFNTWTHEAFSCSAPLLTGSTSSKTAFFLNLNVGDVGHTFVFGPTGSGKTTLLCLIESQFLKYKNANVIILDKGKAARSITMAAGGVYEEPGSNEVAFQPLRDLESNRDLAWASEFIKCLLEMQGVKTSAVMNEAIVTALRQIRDEKEKDRRTLTTFQQYVNYTDPKTGQNDIRTGVQPYTVNGQYGHIFDAEKTKLTLSKWVMIEMGTLMKSGAQAVTPALMFIFHFIEQVFSKPNGDPSGDPTLLVLDEAWVFLDNDYFSRTIEEWLLTMRKKHVFCLFATQEVAKAANSHISSTIFSQCLTKIYLADPSAMNASIAEYYMKFGLEENEITAISHALMKRDYYYKSPLGARMFELNLDKFQLALLTPDHILLDGLEKKYGRKTQKQKPAEILEAKGFHEYKKYLSQGV
jgi:type IV secretion system protein VirB4